jgi:hypothetical protein
MNLLQNNLRPNQDYESYPIRVAGLVYVAAFAPGQGQSVIDQKVSSYLVTNEELLAIPALNSWKLVIGRFDQTLAGWDEQLKNRIAPDKNRLSTSSVI